MVISSFLLLRPSKTYEALKKGTVTRKFSSDFEKRPKFWILDIKACLKKLGIGSGLYEKSVLYLNWI